jgi:hypothetical protein
VVCRPSTATLSIPDPLARSSLRLVWVLKPSLDVALGGADTPGRTINHVEGMFEDFLGEDADQVDGLFEINSPVSSGTEAEESRRRHPG